MGKRFSWRLTAVALLWLLPALSSQALDEVSYKAYIENEKIKFTDKVQFLVVINYGLNTMTPAITPPSFAQFNVLDENRKIQEVGDVHDRYRVLKHVWLLEPIETGRLSIASAIITFQDPTSNLLKNGKTDVVFVEVEPVTEEEAGGSRGQAGAGSNTAAGRAAKGFPWTLAVFGAAGVLVLLGIWAVLKKPAAPVVSPEDQALESLNQAIGHVEEGNLEQYYAALSRALLDYLQNKFRLDAHVLDTAALLQGLSAFAVGAQDMAGLKDFFEVADKAKFAGYVPDEDKMIALHETVKHFIESGRKIKVKVPKQRKKRTEDEEA